MNILITGSGLVGCYTASALLHENHIVQFYDRAPSLEYAQAVTKRAVPVAVGDVRDVQTLATTFARGGIECVVHTAGVMSRNFKADAFDSYTSNIYGAISIAEAARLAGVRRIVICSSLAVYQFSAEPDPIREDHPLAPESLYDHSKLLAERAVRPYCKEFGIELAIMRLAGVYGPGQFAGGSWMGRNLQNLVLAARDTNKVMIDEAELGVNEYLYVKDAAQALAKACTASLASEDILNVGSGCLATPTDIGEAIQAVFSKAAVTYVHSSERNSAAYLNRRSPLSLERTKRVLGYNPLYTSIREGLADYVSELMCLSYALFPGEHR